METNQITVTDLASLKNIIDIACTRGAFKAAEMKQIGDVYDKLTNFLDAVIAQAQAQATENEVAADQPQGE